VKKVRNVQKGKRERDQSVSEKGMNAVRMKKVIAGRKPPANSGKNGRKRERTKVIPEIPLERGRGNGGRKTRDEKGDADLKKLFTPAARKTVRHLKAGEKK